MSTDNVVTQALNRQLRETLGKLDGARKRLTFAKAQQVTEKGLIADGERDADMLRKAISDAGGLPYAGEDEPE